MRNADMIMCEDCGNLILGEWELKHYNGFKKVCKCEPGYLPSGQWTCPACDNDVSQESMVCTHCKALKIE